jgi:hypothetical protein
MRRAARLVGLLATVAGLAASPAWCAATADSAAAAAPAPVAAPLDINRAAPAAIRALPIPPEVAARLTGQTATL